MALGLVLLAASPDAGGPGRGDASGGADDQEADSSDGGSGTSAPEDLSFLCDGTFGAGEANLDAEARWRRKPRSTC